MDEAVRARSKSLFGNRFMLEVCMALSEVQDRVTLTDLVTSNEASSPSLYSAPIKRLVALELLIPAPREGDDHRERWYKPAKTSLWGAAVELHRGRG